MNTFMVEIETILQKQSANETWSVDAIVKLPNRAMSYGDGLFETMVWNGDQVRFFDKHIQRLKTGMQILGLDEDAIDVKELLDLFATEFPNKWKRIRWNVSRAGSGKYTPDTSEIVQTLQISDYKAAPQVKLKADVSMNIRLFPTLWSSFKSLNSLPYVLANQEKVQRGLDEMILLDYRGFISEGSIANIFWTKNGKVFTPALSCSCINGVSRQVILGILDQKKIPFEEGEFIISELENADSVFVSNSSGISYLREFRGVKFLTDPLGFLQLIFD